MITIKDITKSALFVVLIAIGAQITIPLPYVPFTLQVFTLSLTAYLLNKRQIILTLSAYIILGFVGVPIFAGLSSSFMRPTVGFIIGFLPFTLILKRSKTFAILTLYSIGLTILAFYLLHILNLKISIFHIITTYGLIFIPTDIIAIYSAQYISKRRFF